MSNYEEFSVVFSKENIGKALQFLMHPFGGLIFLSFWMHFQVDKVEKWEGISAFNVIWDWNVTSRLMQQKWNAGDTTKSINTMVKPVWDTPDDTLDDNCSAVSSSSDNHLWALEFAIWCDHSSASIVKDGHIPSDLQGFLWLVMG